MRIIPAFDPSVATTQPYIDIGAADANCKLLLYNESNYNLALDFGNGSSSILHAWEARYWTLDGDTPQINWSIESILNVSVPPISSVKGELYGRDERVEGSYPIALVRQTSVGNPGGVKTNVSATSAIANDANAAGTSILETTVTGQTVSNQTVTNDGLWQLSLIIAGVLVQWLKTQTTDPIVQIGAAAHITKILGTLDTAGILSSSGKVQLGISSAGDILDTTATQTFIKASSSVQIQVPNGTTGAIINGNGIVLPSAKHIFWNSGDSLQQTTRFTGNGSGTYSHGGVSAPYIVLPVCNVVGSMTVGYDSVTATNVHVTCGSGLSFAALVMVS